MLLARSQRPTLVTRGSSATLNSGPLRSLATSELGELRLGVTDIVRNLWITMGAPLLADADLMEQHRPAVADA